MKNVAIALLTKDKTELTEQSVRPLLQPNKFDLHWVDGSSTTRGQKFHEHFNFKSMHGNVRGGAGAGIVYALTKMLEASYEYVGLCEQDVLLGDDWFDRAFDLFRVGMEDGFAVGAVSARCYEDRVLFQRPAYAVCHNLGAGTVLFTRDAARLALNNFRSGWTTDNRRVFCQLSGVDIGPFYAFKGGDHQLVADWHFDTVLAAHGFASLALTPSPVQMIGQDPPLAQQGLTIVKEPVTSRIDDERFEFYNAMLWRQREGNRRINVETKFQYDQAASSWTYLPHQLHMIGGRFSGDWKFKEMRAFGEFCWVSGVPDYIDDAVDQVRTSPSFTVPVYGHAMLLMSGGKTGGQVHVVDESSGYEVEPFVASEGEHNQCLQIPLPASVAMRNVRVTCKAPGLCFYRLVTRERQPDDPTQGFDHSYLPSPV